MQNRRYLNCASKKFCSQLVTLCGAGHDSGSGNGNGNGNVNAAAARLLIELEARRRMGHLTSDWGLRQSACDDNDP